MKVETFFFNVYFHVFINISWYDKMHFKFVRKKNYLLEGDNGYSKIGIYLLF